jgi:Domain of unknown function (DUF6457)
VSEEPVVEMDGWLARAADRLAAGAGVPRERLELDEGAIALLLAAAGAAAHESGRRTNAPLYCFLLGVCASSGADLDALQRALENGERRE